MSSRSSQNKFTQKRKKLSLFTRGRIIGQHGSNRNAQEIDDVLGIDWMHLIGCNIGPQMHRLMTTSHYDADSPFVNPLKLTNSSIDDIVVNLAKSHLVPTSFSGCLQSFAFKTGYDRAVDWMHFMNYTISTTILHHFENDAQAALIAMSQICNIVCQRETDEVDITMLKRCIIKWSAWLASSVKDKKLAPWVFGIYQHLLTHLVRTIEWLGPMTSYSALNMETTIGQFKKAIKTKDSGANLILTYFSSVYLFSRVYFFSNVYFFFKCKQQEKILVPMPEMYW